MPHKLAHGEIYAAPIDEIESIVVFALAHEDVIRGENLGLELVEALRRHRHGRGERSWRGGQVGSEGLGHMADGH